MAMEFGKLNFSVSFNPTSAFPLDARSYFESYAKAEEAAAKAVSVGSAESEYFYGQTLVVVENDVAKFYIIQPNNTLTAVEGSNGQTEVPVNSDLFEKDENGNLSLKGFDEAEIGAFFTKGADGTLVWTKPVDAYTKTETDEKIRQAVADAAHVKRKVVNSLQEVEAYKDEADATHFIFMVPTGLADDSDRYDEYMVIELEDSEGIPVRYVEKVGSWEVDLTQYAKINEVESALLLKVDKVENSRLMTNAEGIKLAGIEVGAQANLIKSVDQNNFGVDDLGLLTLKNLNISKINGLEEALNKKIDAKEGYSLVSPTDRDKLNALVIGDNGLEISGKVNASNVEGLSEWIANNANSVIGLSEENFTLDFKEKLETMLYIASVNKEQLEVKNGELSIISVDKSKVTGLEEALNDKVSINVFNDLKYDVEDLSEMMESFVKQEDYDTEINKIWNVLSWQAIGENG